LLNWLACPSRGPFAFQAVAMASFSFDRNHKVFALPVSPIVTLLVCMVTARHSSGKRFKIVVQVFD
jgi:hypothetical protein